MHLITIFLVKELLQITLSTKIQRVPKKLFNSHLFSHGYIFSPTLQN